MVSSACIDPMTERIAPYEPDALVAIELSAFAGRAALGERPVENLIVY